MSGRKKSRSPAIVLPPGSQRGFFLATLLTAASVVRVAASEESVRFDFETGDLGGWRVTEGAFDKPITDRDRFINRPAEKYSKQGKYYLSTVERLDWPSDKMTGVIESPVFVLAGPKMSLLAGGGSHADTYVALCTLDGKEVRHARGQNDEPMHRVAWEVPELVGRKVFLRVVDRNQGGWGHITMDDFVAVGRVDPEATKEHFAFLESRRLKRLVAEFGFGAQRAAVRDLVETFGDRYPRGREFLARIDAIEQRVNTTPPEGLDALAREVDALRRDALTANPLVRESPILFVVREQYRPGGHHAVDTLFHTGENNTNRFRGGGALKTIDFARGGEVKTLLETQEGVVRDPEVHFSGRRIVFALRRNVGEDYHIWEINADGTGLQQRTSAAGVADFDPLYLPDDSIAFSSTREPKYNQCSRDIAANLFRMEPDGANIHQIGKNNLFDNHAALLPDGRILYCRWEYVDRNFGDAHGVWTVAADGTNQAIYWGNNTASPGAVYYARAIPENQRLVCIFGMHHNRLWGAMAVLDRRLALDGRPAVIHTWPEDVIERVRDDGPFDCDGLIDVYPKYEAPYPLNENYFLVARTTMRPGQAWLEGDAKFGHEMGIYLVDVFGNEVLLHVEPPGCFDPMPLGHRPRPPVIPPRRDFENGEGHFYVADVYRGTHMQGVERGAVKSLRVVEVPEKRFWSWGSWNGQGYTAPGMNWHSLEAKQILGTVPVEEDGSAYFAVPAEKFVYFQLLDRNGMMIQSMRSGAVVQSGERTGCVGCHEHRLTAPPSLSSETPLALRRPPSRLEGWHGPPRMFSYIDEVQPVLDKHCVSCHDYGRPAGEKLNLAADRTESFNTSYMELWRRNHVAAIGAGPAEIQPAYGWGSHRSRLVESLRSPDAVPEHKDIRLDPEEFDRIVTWVDVNGVYYPSYASAYPDSQTGRCPLDREQLARLSALTGVPFSRLAHYQTSRGPMLSFDRPELSPCLAKFKDKNDPAYRESLAIIEGGKAMLAKRPRADMPGFVPCEVDRRRDEKYISRRETEMRNREAIRLGKRIYD
jgi:hypothetical protein